MGVRASVSLAVLVAFVLRLGLAMTLPHEPSWDGVLYERAASQVARGEGYTQRMNRADWWASESAFYPPGWPMTLSALKRLGLPRSADLALQSAFGAGAAALASWLALLLWGRRFAAHVAWGVALWPSGVLAASAWMTEPLFTLVLLAAVVPLASALRQRSRGCGTRIREACSLAGAGVLFGAAALVRPTALGLAPVALGAVAWALGWGGRGRTARALGAVLGASLAVCAIAPLAPWMARNQREVGAAVLTTHGGANLHLGTHHAHFAPIPHAAECARGIPELERDRCHRDKALARIAGDPLGWLAAGPVKLAHTFVYDASAAVQLGAGLGLERPASDARVWALAVLTTLFWWGALAAAWVSARRRPRARPLLWLLAPLALTHFVVFGGDRYHAPFVPLLIALGAPALARGCARLRRVGSIEPHGRDVGP